MSVDEPKKNKRFCESESLTFPILSDVGGKVSRAYGSALQVPGFGTFANRQTYIIDPSGVLRWDFLDVEGNIAGHSEEVLKKIEELQKGGDN